MFMISYRDDDNSIKKDKFYDVVGMLRYFDKNNLPLNIIFRDGNILSYEEPVCFSDIEKFGDIVCLYISSSNLELDGENDFF